MAEAEKKHGEICHVSICVVENGYKISCNYEPGEQSLGQRAGWVPPSYVESKDYVEKTKDAVLKRLKELL
jgi:hypothetical protein